MLVIRGSSEIALHLRRQRAPMAEVQFLQRGELPRWPVDRLFVNQGYLGDDAIDTWEANFHGVRRLVELTLANSPEARICVMGSESAYSGSHNEAYALSKAALHRYVEMRALAPGQQLVAVSPGIISDAAMTTGRDDQERVTWRADTHPKRRHVTSAEVARVVHFLLYQDEGYLSNVVIRMHGGRT
jgi:NAD(P)-dependent dehydrogenase (short-subunit alcohol dehydrogenase family)